MNMQYQNQNAELDASIEHEKESSAGRGTLGRTLRSLFAWAYMLFFGLFFVVSLFGNNWSDRFLYGFWWAVGWAVIWAHKRFGKEVAYEAFVKRANVDYADHVRGIRLYNAGQLKIFIELQERGYQKGTNGFKMAEQLLLLNYQKHHLPDVFKGWIRLATVPIPPSVENMHIAITASTGAGKSVALRGLLSEIRARGDRAIVIDNGGEFSQKFGQDGDLYLSAFDRRSQGWDVRNEVLDAHDWLRLARSIVPDGSGSDKSWHDMAQKLIGNIGLSVNPTNEELLEIATGFSAEALKPLLQGTSSAVLLHDGGERLLTNIRSVYATYLQSWQFMAGGDFSLRNYMQGDDQRWLWIPFKESELGVSKQLIASWLDILVTAGLERAEGSQKTWVIIDELDTLGTLGSLIDASTKLRKRNVPIVTAFQSYSQLESNYGKERAETLLNCFSTKLVMRSVDGVTAERLSKELGEQEIWRTSYSDSSTSGASHTRALQLARIVLASEIQGLPDLQGYLRLAGDYPAAKCKVELPA